MIWSQSLFERAIDLVHPTPDAVDFNEIAGMMAGVYRWAGSSPRDISIAQHTLIGLQFCAPEIAPYWLLHDAPETRTGDFTRPMQTALRAVADEVFRDVAATTPGITPGDIVRAALREIDDRHQRAIWAAARLAPPSPGIADAVKAVDNRAMMLERRDFLDNDASRSRRHAIARMRRGNRDGMPAGPWDYPLEAVAEALTAPRWKWLSKPDCCARLFTAFQKHLPVFKPAAA